MKYNTLITEHGDYSAKALKIYESLGRVFIFAQQTYKPDEVDILVVRLGVNLDKKFLAQFPSIKIIASPTTGLNHIDVAEAERRGIKLITLRGRTSFLKRVTATAELTLGLMLALVRKIPWAFDDVKAGRWNRDAFRGHQLSGKTLGIVGFGRLGKMAARFGRALGMKVLAADPKVPMPAMKHSGVKKVSLANLLKNSDVVSLHVLLTDETVNLITKEHFQLMKRTAYFINTARAELVAQKALAEALENKWIAGAATDVLWGEPAGVEHIRNDRLIAYAKTRDNCIIVPHLGGAAYEAMAVTEDFIAEQVAAYVRKAHGAKNRLR